MWKLFQNQVGLPHFVDPHRQYADESIGGRRALNGHLEAGGLHIVLAMLCLQVDRLHAIDVAVCLICILEGAQIDRSGGNFAVALLSEWFHGLPDEFLQGTLLV